jgi:hypothetical protein
MKVDKVGKKNPLILSLHYVNNCLIKLSKRSMDSEPRGAFLSLPFGEMLVEELLDVQSPCKLEKSWLKGLMGLL